MTLIIYIYIVNNMVLNFEGYTFNIAPQIIGEGGNWKVYEPIFLNKNEQNVYRHFVIKESKNKFDVNKYKNIFELLKNRKIPTLDFMHVGQLEGEDVVVTEDLRCRNDELIYVPANLKNTGANIEEENLHTHKLSKIANEDVVNSKIDKLAKLCTENSIMIFDDTIFYGVDTEKEIIYDIIIADLESIIEEKEGAEFHNLDAVQKSFNEFKANYVERP